ncbi:NAD(P)H-dependent oxidoreductase [Alcaligenes sp. SDU_A2]|uniref:NAD(P)H-dependent oxidoreductase n=1 Tax=Alcaligenes sp. SDU_A2 TaxID=3136634 RepID=UPI002CF5DE32|nr:NAD(P)H-dependent oxidoreductase [Alcaligenes sp.]HRL26736.1 NAD(P)H-dependent oxidoreductase [Alcaligenes sp.]
MRCLIVLAHPVPGSLCHHLAAQAQQHLRQAGHQVEVLDLYAQGFDPVLSAQERRAYYAKGEPPVPDSMQQALLQAEGLVLCFPTWWFGFPAILKGWFDRVWSPGVAFDHADDLGPIRARLTNLRHVLAMTTLGSAAWVDLLVMRQPVRRVLRGALLGACAPKAKLDFLSLHRSETATQQRVASFEAKIGARLAQWPRD